MNVALVAEGCVVPVYTLHPIFCDNKNGQKVKESFYSGAITIMYLELAAMLLGYLIIVISHLAQVLRRSRLVAMRHFVPHSPGPWPWLTSGQCRHDRSVADPACPAVGRCLGEH